MEFTRLTEKELKYLIAAEDYSRLIAKAGGNINYTRQVSYFFDAADLNDPGFASLNKMAEGQAYGRERYFTERGCVIRIRVKNGKYTLTVKDGGEEDKNGGVFTRNEFNRDVDAKFLSFSLRYGIDISGLPQEFAAYGKDRALGFEMPAPGISKLEYIGSAFTLRARYEIAPGCILILDKNDYGRDTDHEIEFEYADESQSLFLKGF